jgi:hypothetical protein
LRGRDDDKTGNLKYGFDGYIPGIYFFGVNENNGEVFVKEDLKSDKSMEYQMLAYVYDTDNPENRAYANVTIAMKRNENKPRFEKSDYLETILEIEAIGSSITQVKANDRDGDDVEYIMVASPSYSDSMSFFYTNPDTGVVTLSQPLSQSNRTEFRFSVIGVDGGYPAQNSSNEARVIIRINRNRDYPRFEKTSYSGAIEEKLAVGGSVIDVRAKDSDQQGPFSEVYYSLIGDDQGPTFFAIDEKSGRITVKRDLRTENVDFYTLRVLAADGGSPAMTSTTLVKLEMLRNFNEPRFSPRDYNKEILETQDLGLSIL